MSGKPTKQRPWNDFEDLSSFTPLFACEFSSVIFEALPQAEEPPRVLSGLVAKRARCLSPTIFHWNVKRDTPYRRRQRYIKRAVHTIRSHCAKRHRSREVSYKKITDYFVECFQVFVHITINHPRLLSPVLQSNLREQRRSVFFLTQRISNLTIYNVCTYANSEWDESN